MLRITFPFVGVDSDEVAILVIFLPFLCVGMLCIFVCIVFFLFFLSFFPKFSYCRQLVPATWYDLTWRIIGYNFLSLFLLLLLLLMLFSSSSSSLFSTLLCTSTVCAVSYFLTYSFYRCRLLVFLLLYKIFPFRIFSSSSASLICFHYLLLFECELIDHRCGADITQCIYSLSTAILTPYDVRLSSFKIQ